MVPVESHPRLTLRVAPTLRDALAVRAYLRIATAQRMGAACEEDRKWALRGFGLGGILSRSSSPLWSPALSFFSSEVLRRLTTDADKIDLVAVLTLNRRSKPNALDGELRGAMLEALRSVRSDDDVHAVILTGAGRGFCSGAELTGGLGDEPKPPTQNDHLDNLGWAVRQALVVYWLDNLLSSRSTASQSVRG